MSGVGKNALLAWQIGDGRGHNQQAADRRGGSAARGVACTVALTRLDHARELSHAASAMHALPPLPYTHDLRMKSGHKPAATYGEFLGDLGFASAAVVDRHVGLWRQMIGSVAPDIVIGEQAPCAVLAARSLHIPVVALGNTYTLPPTSLESLPILLDEYQERIWSEADMCKTINETVAPLGVPPLTRLSEIYHADCRTSGGHSFARSLR